MRLLRCRSHTEPVVSGLMSRLLSLQSYYDHLFTRRRTGAPLIGLNHLHRVRNQSRGPRWTTGQSFSGISSLSDRLFEISEMNTIFRKNIRNSREKNSFRIYLFIFSSFCQPFDQRIYISHFVCVFDYRSAKPKIGLCSSIKR